MAFLTGLVDAMEVGRSTDLVAEVEVVFLLTAILEAVVAGKLVGSMRVVEMLVEVRTSRESGCSRLSFEIGSMMSN